MTTILYYLLVLTGAYLTGYVLYNAILFSAHFILKEKQTPWSAPVARFCVIVPAYNEELLIGRLMESINDQTYPRALFETIVVADNCSDNTAGIAAAAGARVLERKDLQHGGKGYALKYALEHMTLPDYDAVLIIDADSVVSKSLLLTLDHALSEGKTIIQCYNGVGNADSSWFTQILDVSRTINNVIYHPTKQKLGLSSHLMGNGMCFRSAVLARFGWDAFTIGEDWEYYAKLLLWGETISFARDAQVLHQESSSMRQATSQRLRWSSGRFAVAWKYGLALAYRGLVERNIVKIDASFPLLFPNPSLGANCTMAGLLLSFMLPWSPDGRTMVLWFCALLAGQLSMFFVGIMYSRDKVKKLRSLCKAPLFLLWKMTIDIISFFGAGKTKWVRTARRL